MFQLGKLALPIEQLEEFESSALQVVFQEKFVAFF